MSKSFKTFLKHTAKDYHNQSVNPPVVRASTIIFKTIQDIRFNKQLSSFEKSADKVLKEIAEASGTAFYNKATATKLSGASGAELAGSLNSTD